MELFAATCYASKQVGESVQTAFSTNAVMAENEDAAQEKMLEACKKRFAAFDTYQVSLCLIPSNVLMRHDSTGEVYRVGLTKVDNNISSQ